MKARELKAVLRVLRQEDVLEATVGDVRVRFRDRSPQPAETAAAPAEALALQQRVAELEAALATHAEAEEERLLLPEGVIDPVARIQAITNKFAGRS